MDHAQSAALLLACAVFAGLPTTATADQPGDAAPPKAEVVGPDLDGIKMKLRQAAEASQKQVRGNLDAAARKTLESAIDDALSKLDAGSDAADTLRRALADARTEAGDRPAVDRLQGGISEAIVAMDFQPLMEAPLPEGFPAPGPVGKVVVKQYPAYRLAKTAMTSDEQGKPFNTLFKHIQSNDIAMTAPVEMTYAADEKLQPQSMAFLYRTTKQGKVGEQGSVAVEDVPAMTVISIGVRGNYTRDRMTAAVAKLRKWLKENEKYQAAGDPRYLGYNSPFILPWMRYGEVQIPVKERG